ncbi:TRAP transporter substrate-binding protein [Roseinatronobacter alkalisoli]|uniref:TRAP transporter substrate-binding protein n=1 Tax=Roseinatronobacter alkalisoli TaxID=3028235 RepID=A0ABT5TC39_9RHOB|nr:TRAP transporter substrate-binding protein [Roseinatronobacter sp. HJB301]MDD7972683.1 TRAP transporter substrate-binding protein [Roseinatronobacter sp. HJB301]
MTTGKTLAFALGTLMAVSPAHASEVTMRFSTFGTATTPYYVCSDRAILDQIEEESGGRITVETFLGGTAFANPVMQYQQIAQGVIDMSEGVLSYTPGRFSLTEIAALPLIADDNVVASIALTRLAPEWLAAEFADIHLMGLVLTTPFQIHMARPAETFTSLEGRRMRVSGSAMTAMTEAFGGTAAGMPLPEVYEALQRGVLDGAIANWSAVGSFNLAEVTQQHFIADVGFGQTFFGMSRGFYESLPDDLRTLIDTRFTGERIAEHGAECFREIDQRGLEAARARGNEIIEVSEEDRAAAAARLQPLIDNLIAEVEASGKPARAFYEAFQAEMEIVRAERANR